MIDKPQLPEGILTDEQVFCPECGERRIRTSENMGVCPGGHGRLIHGFTRSALSRRATWERRRAFESLDVPKAIRAEWYIPGVGTAVWIRRARYRDTPESLGPDYVLAKIRTVPQVFRIVMREGGDQ